MSKEIEERNQKVKTILESLYTSANNENLTIDDSEYIKSLNILFDTTAWGFREMLLVVIISMKLDSNYKASTGLYESKPRAIYEGPIKEFLISKNIPHRKSGPLNVAKATKGLDESWAAQRRPAEVAKEVVKLINYLEGNDSSTKVNNVGISLMKLFINESLRIENLSFEITPTEDPEVLSYFCYKLVSETPDSGNTPQKIAALLLSNYHKGMNTGIVVTGIDDRASTTSSTSGKPGDVNEESVDGVIYKVYEITVKKFDLARIRDSFDAVSIYNNANNLNLKEIIVVCRKQDCPTEMQRSNFSSYLGSYTYNNLIYYYWDIYEWMNDTLQRMTSESRQSCYSDLNEYISDINTSETVKSFWRELNNISQFVNLS